MELKSKYQQLREREEAFEAELSSLDPNVIAQKPDENSWSLLEISHHLFLVESNTLQAVEKQISSSEETASLGIMSKIRLWFLKRILNGSIRVKVPVAKVLPRSDVTFQEIKDGWRHFHSSWPAIIDGFDPKRANQRVFRHPVAGWMSLSQTVEFLLTHMEHHMAQVARTRKKLGV